MVPKLILAQGGGDGIRTRDLLVMSQPSYRCSTPLSDSSIAWILSRPYICLLARYPTIIALLSC